MNRTKFTLLFVVIIFLIIIAVFFYGRYQGKTVALLEDRPSIVNSQGILERITDQYFLVTKTVFINSKVEIETPKNNDWTDLFTGKKLTVLGLIRVDVGVDMKNMRPENIVVDSQKKIVTISLPHADILDSSLSGQLDIVADKSIAEKLKSLLKNTNNEDYNLALETLISSANSQVTADESIFNEAREDSAKVINLIVSGMLKDYQIVIE
ncbi:DUF4230 domain-containing protein [Candidatus Falkowbacteria bacterium]|nr:DUF4230 domain-containing protein [Candidatus Falkowbacteria bacterium]